MKLRITESQLKRLKENLGTVEDNRYQRQVSARLYAKSYKGFEINDLITDKILVSFVIDIEARGYGIKGISLHGISGPKMIDAQISYYPNGDNAVDEGLSIALDWDKIQVEEINGHGMITVGDEIEIYLDYQENGFVVTKIEVPVYKF